MSKIKTLFEDSAKQTAIYPRTKFSAVSDTNGNTLGDVATLTSTTVVSGATSPLIYAQPFGIDTDRLITSGTATSYTATEDCFLAFTSSQTDGPRIKIGGVTVFNGYSAGNSGCIFLKEGQTATSHYGGGQGSANMSYKAYGLKY